MDKNLILSSPAKEGIPTVEGARLMPCSGCQVDLWISPSSLLMVNLENEPYDVICLPCLHKLRQQSIKDNKFIPIETIAPGTLPLLNLTPGEVDKFVAAFNTEINDPDNFK